MTITKEFPVTSLQDKSAKVLISMVRVRRSKTSGLSLPVALWNRINEDRGEVSISRFLLHVIENHYAKVDGGKKKSGVR